jgi:hypothetical protein
MSYCWIMKLCFMPGRVSSKLSGKLPAIVEVTCVRFQVLKNVTCQNISFCGVTPFILVDRRLWPTLCFYFEGRRWRRQVAAEFWYLILIYLLIALGLTPGGSSAVHIYTRAIHRTTQLTTLVGKLSGIRTQSGQTKINDELTACRRQFLFSCLFHFILLAQNGAGVTPLVMNWMPSVEISFLRCNKATSWLWHLDPNHGLAPSWMWACCQIKLCGKRHREMKKKVAHSPCPDTRVNRIQFTDLASLLYTNKIFNRVLFVWDWVNP